MGNIFGILIALAFSSLAFAGPKQPSKVSQKTIDKLATEYFVSEAFGSKMKLLAVTEQQGCEDQQEERGSSCVDSACEYLGKFGCDDVSEIERVGRACRGNVNGGCVDASCKKLGRFGCDDVSEIERVTNSCRGHHGGKCVDIACSHMGNFGCDDMSEIERVNAACRNVKGSCVESVCARLGHFGCDDISEIERVTESCRGN